MKKEQNIYIWAHAFNIDIKKITWGFQNDIGFHFIT